LEIVVLQVSSLSWQEILKWSQNPRRYLHHRFSLCIMSIAVGVDWSTRIVLLISRKGFHFILKAKKKVVSEFVNPRRVVLFFLVILIVSYNQNSVQLVIHRYISSKWRDRYLRILALPVNFDIDWEDLLHKTRNLKSGEMFSILPVKV
jgi:hypothetical protein